MRGHNIQQERLEVMQANAALVSIAEEDVPAWAKTPHPKEAKEQNRAR